MNKLKSGVIPSQEIRKLNYEKVIFSAENIYNDQVQPSSLDLRLSASAWRMRASFLPGENQKVEVRLREYAMQEIDLSNGFILEKGSVYLVRLQENLNLPKNIEAIANAKSSTGRLDLFTRLIADSSTEFDHVPKGYSGPLYAEICPQSFSVVARVGTRLNQIRFRYNKVLVNDAELAKIHLESNLLNTKPHINNGLSFSVNLKENMNEAIGYRAKPHTGLIDLDKRNYYHVDDFWDVLSPNKERVILDPGAFYILASRESVYIPADFAAEMAPYVTMIGEFRVHYAGFFDPGFGSQKTGGKGSKGVLEVRCHDTPFVLEHGQIVGRLIYERMAETPDLLYGSAIASNYQGQGLKLSKHFRQ